MDKIITKKVTETFRKNPILMESLVIWKRQLEKKSPKEIAKELSIKPSVVYNIVKASNVQRWSKKQILVPETRGAPSKKKILEKYAILIRNLKDKSFSNEHIANVISKKSGMVISRKIIERYYPEIKDLAISGSPKSRSTAFGGFFLFLPFINSLGLDMIIEKSGFPGINGLDAITYFKTFLFQKCCGIKRISHIESYKDDVILRLFLNAKVPSRSSLFNQTYRTINSTYDTCFKEVLKKQDENLEFPLDVVHLDFHAIEYCGESRVPESNWNGNKHSTIKSNLAFIALDEISENPCYINSDIIRKESSEEIIRFVDTMKDVLGKYPKLLLFDSTLTSYDYLEKIDQQSIKFISIKRKNKAEYKYYNSLKNEDFESISLRIAKGKKRKCRVHTKTIKMFRRKTEIKVVYLKQNETEFSCFFTNDLELDAKETIETYSTRQHVEQEYQEMIEAFGFDKLSSDIFLNNKYQLLLNIIATFAINHLKRHLDKFAKAKAERILRDFIRVPAMIREEAQEILIELDYKRTNALFDLLDFNSLDMSLNGKKVRYLI